jgi:hypothetical protein
MKMKKRGGITMNPYIETAIILPVFVLCYQLYSFSVKSEGLDRQARCQKLGVTFTTIGICALVIKSAPTAFFGLILIMFGIRLMAKGLDRLDKNTFIDCYDESSK